MIVQVCRTQVASDKTMASRLVVLVSLFVVTFALLLCASNGIHANSINELTAQQQQQQAGYNNLENLISELLDDAGNRLKKSKLSSMRQIKQTLRFGRRSDPFMAPTSFGGGGEQFDVLANSNNRAAAEQQRRLMALQDD